MTGPSQIDSMQLEMRRADGSLFSRVEMESQIREAWKGHQIKRLKAIDLGMKAKIAFDTPTIIILHWILDQMVKKGEVSGDSLGVDIPEPGYYDDPNSAHYRQFTQRLALAIENGAAMTPKKGEINMSDVRVPPPTVSPSNGAYTPPVAMPMGTTTPAIQQPNAQTVSEQPAAISTELVFPKEDPTRAWGKSAKGGRRTKQEIGEDLLWESLGKPDIRLYGTFKDVYGLSYDKAKKAGMLGAGGEFPQIPSTKVSKTTQQEGQQMSNIPTPPGAPTPPVPTPAASPPAPQATAPAPGAPVPHPNAPQVPPPPGAPPLPGQAPTAAPSMPMPPGMAGGLPTAPQAMPPTPQATGNTFTGPDLSEVLKNQQEILANQKRLDVALAILGRTMWQKPGNYTLAEFLAEIGVQVPQ